MKLPPSSLASSIRSHHHGDIDPKAGDISCLTVFLGLVVPSGLMVTEHNALTSIAARA
jgi:hypothetical protein